eukprot:348559_1
MQHAFSGIVWANMLLVVVYHVPLAVWLVVDAILGGYCLGHWLQPCANTHLFIPTIGWILHCLFCWRHQMKYSLHNADHYLVKDLVNVEDSSSSFRHQLTHESFGSIIM